MNWGTYVEWTSVEQQRHKSSFQAQRQIIYLVMMKVVIAKMVWNKKTFKFKQFEKENAMSSCF
jgi:hypothetical protein